MFDHSHMHVYHTKVEQRGVVHRSPPPPAALGLLSPAGFDDSQPHTPVSRKARCGKHSVSCWVWLPAAPIHTTSVTQLLGDPPAPGHRLHVAGTRLCRFSFWILFLAGAPPARRRCRRSPGDRRGAAARGSYRGPCDRRGGGWQAREEEQTAAQADTACMWVNVHAFRHARERVSHRRPLFRAMHGMCSSGGERAPHSLL